MIQQDHLAETNEGPQPSRGPKTTKGRVPLPWNGGRAQPSRNHPVGGQATSLSLRLLPSGPSPELSLSSRAVLYLSSPSGTGFQATALVFEFWAYHLPAYQYSLNLMKPQFFHPQNKNNHSCLVGLYKDQRLCK